MAQGIRLVAYVTGLLLLLALAFSLAALVIPYWSVWESRRGAWIRYGLWQYCSSGDLEQLGCHAIHPDKGKDWLYGCCAMMLLCCVCNLIGLSLAIVGATCKQIKGILLAIAVPSFLAALSGAIACGLWSAHWLDLDIVGHQYTDLEPYDDKRLRPYKERGLWLAVVATALSFLAFLLALIPMCVDRDAMDQPLPYYPNKTISHVSVRNGSSVAGDLDRHSRSGDRLSLNGDMAKPIYYVSDPGGYRERSHGQYFVESRSSLHDTSGYIEDPWSQQGKTFVEQSQPLRLVSNSSNYKPRDVETTTQFIPVVQGYLVQDGRRSVYSEGRPVVYIQR